MVLHRSRGKDTRRVDLKPPSLMRPNSTLQLPVKVGGLAAGEEARVVVAAVDVGILNLTNYKPPSPDDYYLGQRALSADIRDLYGELIDGMQGTRGQIRYRRRRGRAAAGKSADAGRRSRSIPASSRVGADGTAEVDLRRPRLRRHAARHGGGVEQGQGRPRQRRRSRARSGRAHRDAAALPAARRPIRACISISTMSKAQPATTPSPSPARTPLGRRWRHAEADACAPRSAAPRPCRSPPTRPATAPCKVSVSGPAGFALERSFTLTVRSPAQILARRTVKPIAKGESLTLSSDMFADLVPGTGAVSVSVGASAALDAASLLAALDRYPYRCSEQITSRALPLLYVSELARRRMSRSIRRRDQHIRDCDRGAADAAGFATARSACGASAATMSGSTPMSPTF